MWVAWGSRYLEFDSQIIETDVAETRRMVEALERDEHTATYVEDDGRGWSAATAAETDDADDAASSPGRERETDSERAASSGRSRSTTESATRDRADTARTTDRSAVDAGGDPLADDTGSSDDALDRD